jgi:hypothetical protein
VRLPDGGRAKEQHIVGLGQKPAGGELTHQPLIDRLRQISPHGMARQAHRAGDRLAAHALATLFDLPASRVRISWLSFFFDRRRSPPGTEFRPVLLRREIPDFTAPFPFLLYDVPDVDVSAHQPVGHVIDQVTL